MRTIKFRGRDEDGQWCYGFISWYTDVLAYINDGTDWEVSPETVGQFTGLKDADGREIYEGDIIKTHVGDVGVIVWETELGGFRARLTDDSFYTLTALFASMFSVIGNIYDTPELLEAHA